MRVLLKDNSYQEVRTPQLYQSNMWDRSGHSDHYNDHIFKIADSNILLKPMNCPGHIQIFNKKSISYKHLPIRLAEFGCCHRNEPSGSLNGMFRVRQFVQDDAHIFCEMSSLKDEIYRFCNLLDIVYKRFGFNDYSVACSLRPEKRSGDDNLWDFSENCLIEIINDLGISHHLIQGEGAFYGPKLEFYLKDSHGRKWQCGTLQLDFILPEKLDAKYTDVDGKIKHPVMIHRAILGSMERFIAILLEHHNGKLPLWLCPIQYSIINVNSEEWARKVETVIKDYRYEFDNRVDLNLSKRIKDGENNGVHNIIVIGEKESLNESLSIRNNNKIHEISINEFMNKYLHERNIIRSIL